MTADILFIGHCTKDEITIRGKTDYLPGGGSYFGAASAGWCQKRFNPTDPKKLTVYTIGKPSDFETMIPELAKAGVKVDLIEDNHTTTFAHCFKDDDPDQRISTVPDKARVYTLDDFKDCHAKVFYVNPLFYGEIDPSLFAKIKGQCEYLSCDAQGLIRRLESANIVKRPPTDLKSALEGIDILKVDIDEAAILTGLPKGETIQACHFLQGLGPKYVICTESKGVAFFDGEKRFWAEFGEWRLEGRTGRGDTLSAAFIYLHFVLGYETQRALDIAAEGCSKKMMHSGCAVEADFASIK